MATGPGYPSGTNTFIPQLNGKLQIGFARNPNKFHLPKYIQMIESPETIGYYLKITSQEAARVVNIQDFQWPDGDPDRSADTGTESFNFVSYLTQRNSYKFRLGDKAAKQAVWPIVEQHAGIKSATLMTCRTIRTLTAATTTANWQQTADPENMSVDHVLNAASIPGVGGYLDQGTGTTPYLKLAFGYFLDIVNQDTLGVMDSEVDVYYAIFNPRSARLLASSPEIHDYISHSPDALNEIRTGGSKFPNAKYGLPGELYGIKLIIENCVRVTSRKGDTRASSYAMPNQKLLFVSRPGGLEGIYGGPSFSTLSLFYYKDLLTVETKNDSWDRLTYGRVTEDTTEQVTCPASGFLVNAAFSS